MSETTNTSNQPDPNQPDTATRNASTTESPSTTPTTGRPTSGKRKLLVGGGSILAALLLAGGGIAVGAAIADENDDDGDGVSTNAVSQQDERDSGDDDTVDDTDNETDDRTASAGHVGSTSADELIEIVDAAASEADGTAVSIDAGSDGSWDVEFRAGSGDETEVRVASDGTATVISTEAADSGDAAPQGGLDAETLKALVAAALGKVDGRIVDVEVDDDTTSPYDISVLTGEGRTVDLSLDAQMNVLTTDTDD
jgi:hypothetical protein